MRTFILKSALAASLAIAPIAGAFAAPVDQVEQQRAEIHGAVDNSYKSEPAKAVRWFFNSSGTTNSTPNLIEQQALLNHG